MIKLSRREELALINYGLQKLLEERGMTSKPKKTTKKNKWSKSQHEKYAATMARKWNKKRKGHGKTS